MPPTTHESLSEASIRPSDDERRQYLSPINTAGGLAQAHPLNSTMTEPRQLKTVTPIPGAAPEVSNWLWALEEVRHGLLETVSGLDQAALDWLGPSGRDNSIGSLLYHVALVEMSWLYEDILLESYPDDVIALFPQNHRTPDGRLAIVTDAPLAKHLDRLAATRARFLELMTPMALTDWHTVREPEGADYACSPAWVVFHLVEHEAGHLFQIREIARRWVAGQEGP